MDRRVGRSARNRRRLVILLALVALPSLLHSQQDSVQINKSPERAVRGNRVTLTYLFPHPFDPQWEVESYEPDPTMDSIITPQISPAYVKTEQGEVEVMRVKVILRPSIRGMFTLPPVVITNGVESLTSPEVILPVLGYDERKRNYPLFLNWSSALPKTVYTGETFPLILMLENLETITFPERITFPSPKNCFTDKSPLSTEIDTSILKETTLYNLPVDTWLITPSKQGTLTIPQAETHLGSLRRKTPPVTIEVLPLPQEVQETGAVGRFHFSAEMERDEAVENEILSLNLILEGSGNFNYLKIPEPVLGEFSLIRKTEESDIHGTMKGYRGTMTLSYKIQALDKGLYTVTVPAFHWLDPESGRIHQQRSTSFHINIKEETLPTQAEEEKMSPLPLRTIQLHSFRFTYKNPYMYLLLLPGLIYLALVLIFKKFGKGHVFLLTIAALVLSGSGAFLSRDYDYDVTSGLDYFQKENYEQALNSFSRALEKESDNPGLLYNLGLVYERMENPAQAAFLYRKALKHRPWLKQARSGISRVEKKFILEHQYPLPALINSETFFFLSLISLNLICFGIAMYARKKKVRSVILFLTFSILLLPLTGIMGYSEWERSRPYAVVGEQGGAFKRVPGELASQWLTLTPGTTVLIKAHSEQYYLVKTGYNVEGWLQKSEFNLLSENWEPLP